jgi:hypothetical protein
MSEEDFGTSDDQPTKRHYFANPLKAKSSQEPARTFAAQEMPNASGQPTGSKSVRLHLTHIDPWSAAKSAFMLGVTIAGVLLVAVIVLWGALSAAGVFDAISGLWNDAAGSDGAGVSFLSLGRLIGLTMVISAIEIVLLSVLSALYAVLYNLSVGFTGGREWTLTDRSQ